MFNNFPGYWFIKNKIRSLKKGDYKYKKNNVVIHHRGNDADLGVIDQIFNKKDYDLTKLTRNKEIIEFYENSKKPLIIDAGANIGVSSIWFSQNFPKARIIAIEPQSANFALLTLNTKELNVNPIHGALSNQCGTIKVFDPGHGEWGFRTGQHEGDCMEEVKSYDLPALLELNATPFILKIDIEGGEADVFKDNTELFNKFPLIIIELHDWMLPKSGSSQSFLRWHSAQNRDFVYINENVFSISNDF